jgi:hypothetical protein
MIPTPVTLYYNPTTPYVRILNLSDMHLGAADFARKDFRNCLTENMADPNTYLITNGDAMDCITARDKRFETGGIAKEYLALRPDEILDLQVDDLTSELEPYKDRIIGLGMGNHERKAVTEFNTNPHRRVCTNLGVRNLGYSAILTIDLKPRGGNGKNGKKRIFTIMQHHGFGGSTRTEGGALSSCCQYTNYFNVDAAFFGHKHDYVYKRFPRLDVKNGGTRLHHRDIIVALTGSFLKTFNHEDMPNYAEVAGYRPTILQGGWVLKLIPLTDGGIKTRMSEA